MKITTPRVRIIRMGLMEKEVMPSSAKAIIFFSGTLSGTARYLKSVCPDLKVIAVEPKNSPLISEGKAGAHGLQGIGANFIPKNFDATLVDEVITVTEEEAYAAARALAKREGLLCGITSGAALHAATVCAKREEYDGKNIVVILPDTGDRYLSTPLFE